jgi:PAS domain S-box-containing protein
MTMTISFRKKILSSLQGKFLAVISSIILCSTIVSSIVIAVYEKKLLHDSLVSRGQSFASYMAKLVKDPLVMKDSIQLDAIVSDANKDEDIVYAVIRDSQGEYLTSQYASINYRSPRLMTLLTGLSRDSEIREIVAAISRHEPVTELTVPVMIDIKPVGSITIGLSEYSINKQIFKTITFVVALNLLTAFILGVVLFLTSKKLILTPILELADASARLAKGDLSTQVNVVTTGELKALVGNFNQMATDLNRTTVSRDYVNNIIGSMNETLVVISRDNKIMSANTALCTLLGYKEDELIGKPLETIIDSDNFDSIIISDIFVKGFVTAVELSYRTRAGESIPMLFSSSLFSTDTKIHGTICVATDITARIKTEKELQKKNAEIEQFIYTVSHDLRSPLVTVKTFLGFLEGDMARSNQERVSQDLQFIHNAADKMKLLLDELLEMSRIDRVETPPVNVTFMEVVKESLDALAGVITERKVDIHLPATDLMLFGDRRRLCQIWQNLIENAIKYSHDDLIPRIELGVQQISEETIFFIKDNGIGVNPQYHSKIFGIFEKLDPKSPGAGMGLSMIKKIVEKGGGRVWVESEGIGKGSSFFFTLPLALVTTDPVSSSLT